MSQSIQEQARLKSLDWAVQNVNDRNYEEFSLMDVFQTGYCAGASSLQGEVERLRKALESVHKQVAEQVFSGTGNLMEAYQTAEAALNK